MVKYEKYTGEKTYMYPNGVLATPEMVYAKHEAAKVFDFVVGTDELGQVMWSFDNLSALRSANDIDPSLSEDEAIAALEEIANTAKATEVITDQTRIADALEDMVVLQELATV